MSTNAHIVSDEAEQNVELFVVNEQLTLHHQFYVNPTMTGMEFYKIVHTELALKENVSTMGGRMGLKLHYQLLLNRMPLDNSETSLANAGVQDGAKIELKITVTQLVSTGISEPVDYRADEKSQNTIPDAIKRQLLRNAFAHLIPQSS